MHRILPILTLVVLTSPSAAQTIDAQGATQLGDTLARYVSSAAFEKGIVKVAADGDAYKIDISLTGLAGLVPPGPFKFEVAPYALRVKPLADGTWQVDGPLFPDGGFEITEPTAKQRMNWAVADGKMTGVFDPALGTFATGSGSFAGVKLVTDAPTGAGETSYGAGTVEMTGTKSVNGGVDFTSKQTIADFVQTQNIVEPSSGTNIALTIQAASLSMDGAGSGLKMNAFLDLLAFGVANPDPEKIKAKQEQLKSLLLAALPVWDHVNGSYTLSKLSVTTPFGIARSGKAGLSVAMDGIRQNGSLTYAVKLSDLEVASLFMPAWARPLLPTEMDLTVSGENINLEEPARKLIGVLDLSQEPPFPAAVTDEIAAEFTANPPKVVVGRSSIRNADTEIVAEGEFTFPDSKPTLDMTFEAAGYDKAVAGLQAAAAADPQLAEILPAAMMIKGFAKTLPDGRLEWAVNVKPDGSVLVNGLMVKPADSPPQ